MELCVVFCQFGKRKGKGNSKNHPFESEIRFINFKF